MATMPLAKPEPSPSISPRKNHSLADTLSAFQKFLKNDFITLSVDTLYETTGSLLKCQYSEAIKYCHHLLFLFLEMYAFAAVSFGCNVIAFS